MVLLFFLHRSSGAGVEEDQSSTLASESLQCLQALSSSDVGVLHLLRNKTPESLARVLVMQSPGLFTIIVLFCFVFTSP